MKDTKMKKHILSINILILIFLFWGNTALAQDNADHLEFKGVPLNGKITEFVQKIEKQGFHTSERLETAVIMEGKFTGKDATILVAASKKSKTVWKVKVFLPKRTSWSSIKSDYMYYKEVFTKKYGNPTDNYEFFSKPYYEGDGYEMSALRNEKCHYISAYSTNHGVIYIEMTSSEEIAISYEDKINTEIMNREKEESVIDDI